MGESTRASGRATSSCRWPTSGTSRSSRCSTTPPVTRRPSGRPCGPAPRPAAAGSAGSSQVDDISEVETRLGREAVLGNRHRPDGVELRWKQLGVKGLQADPQLPYFIEWEHGVPHPSDRRAHRGHDRDPADRRRPRPGARLARPARRLHLVGHRLRVRLAARHPRPDGGHLRHRRRARSPSDPLPRLIAKYPRAPRLQGRCAWIREVVRAASRAAAGCSTPRARSTGPSRPRRSSG